MTQVKLDFIPDIDVDIFPALIVLERNLFPIHSPIMSRESNFWMENDHEGVFPAKRRILSPKVQCGLTDGHHLIIMLNRKK
jgi:hypothetical protein